MKKYERENEKKTRDRVRKGGGGVTAREKEREL